MLESLQLKNFILVKDMVIDFKSGFNVITGETGAGKSLIIKSLALLSGEMASEIVIHPDEDMAFIEASFYVPEDISIPAEYLDHRRLTVSRRIFRSRATVNKLNYESVSLKVLKEIMSKILFLTAQHQVIELLDSSNHMSLFDVYMDTEGQTLLTDYSDAYLRYSTLLEKQKKVIHDQAHLKTELHELESLVKDIDLQLFKKGEEEELQKEQQKCEALQERKSFVDQIRATADDTVSKLTDLDHKLLQLGQLTETSTKFDSANIIEELNQLYQVMTQESLEIEYLESIDLDEINNRLNQIFKAKVKYQVNTLDELLEKYEKAKKKIEYLTQLLSSSTDLADDVKQSYTVAFSVATSLSKKRRKMKDAFKFIVSNQLKQLGMIEAKFDAVFTDFDGLSIHGVDSIEFQFSANPNMPLNSLKKIASGGELSRVMLALIVGHSSVLKHPILIFDEVDVGVGGITANYMGNVIKELGKNYQLIVVTHLPQIARCADHHFKIVKTVKANESCVTIKEIRKDDVPIELQRMVGGDVVASLIK